MTCYQKIINDLGLHANSQGTHYCESLLFVLLSKLNAVDTTPDSHSNAVTELLNNRLGSYANTPALKEYIAPLLVPRAPRFGAV